MEIENRSKLRLKLVFLLILFFFVVILVRLFYIQVIDRAKYQKLAELQQIRKIELRAKRGNIYDRNGVLLATTVEASSFAIDPQLVRKDSLAMVQFFSFANILGISNEQINSFLNSKRNFQWLRRGLIEYPPMLDTFGFQGLIVSKEPRRFYLFGKALSNVIGVTNLDNSGITGLELALDSILKGLDGFAFFLRDARGQLIPNFDLPSVNPINGKDIKLTIDINLQRISSYFLQDGIEKTRSKGGCVIAMNPRNGEILAMVSYPLFNPNNSQSWNETIDKNYAVNFLFEPGSTLKPIIAAIALQRKIASPDEIFNAFNGKFLIGDVQITDEHPASKLTLEEAIIYSSNIVFSQISGRIPPEIFLSELSKCGFGKKVGIEIAGELSGSIPQANNLTSIQQKFLGFGYGLSVTPIQLAAAYTAIANEGVMVKPRITLAQSKFMLKDTIIQRETAGKLKEMLVKVVEFGTAVETKIEGIKIAGKTGTAQKFTDGAYSKTQYINSFVGFLPAENPKILILVMLDEPQSSIYASSTVVPIFKKIVLAIYNSPLLHQLLE
jgi:cell division protein FtsI/penicillin-binding protein 2